MMTREKRLKRKIKKAYSKAPRSTKELFDYLKLTNLNDMMLTVEIVDEMFNDGEVIPTQDGRMDLWRPR